MTPGRLAALCLAAALVAGCGLKGALSLPEKSSNVVIRGQAAGAGATTEASPAAPAAPAPATPAAPEAEPKLPPPDLPHSNAGSSR